MINKITLALFIMTAATIKQPNPLFGLFDSEPKNQLQWLRDNNRPNLSCKLSFSNTPFANITPSENVTPTPSPSKMKQRILTSRIDGNGSQRQSLTESQKKAANGSQIHANIINQSPSRSINESELEHSIVNNPLDNRTADIMNQLKTNLVQNQNLLSNSQNAKILIDQEQPNLQVNRQNQGTLHMPMNYNSSSLEDDRSVHESQLDTSEMEQLAQNRQFNQNLVVQNSVEDSQRDNYLEDRLNRSAKQRFNIPVSNLVESRPSLHQSQLEASELNNSLQQKIRNGVQQRYNIPAQNQYVMANQSQEDMSLNSSLKNKLLTGIQNNYNLPIYNQASVNQSEEEYHNQSQVFSNKDDISLTESQLQEIENREQLKNQLAQDALQEKISHAQSRSGSRKTSQRSNMFDGEDHDERIVFHDDSQELKANPKYLKKLSTKGESMVVAEEPSYMRVECNGVTTLADNYTCNGKGTMKIVVKNYVGRKEHVVFIKEVADKGLSKYFVGDLKKANLEWNADECVLSVSSSKILSMIVVAVVALFAF